MQREIEKEDELQLQDDEDLDGFHHWWSYAKVALIMMIGVTVVGCCFTVLSARYAFSVIFPDYYIEHHGGPGVIDKFNWACPTAYSKFLIEYLVHNIMLFYMLILLIN